MTKNYWKKSLLSSSLGSLTHTFFNILIIYVFSNLYEKEVLGDYTLVISTVTIITVFSKMGLDNAILFFISKYKRRIISLFFIISFFSSNFCAIVYFGFFSNLGHKLPIYLMIITITFNEIFFSIFKFENKVIDYFKVKIFFGQFLLLIFISILYFLDKFSLEIIFIFYSLSCVVQSMIFFKIYSRDFKFFNFNHKNEVIRYSFPLLFSAAFGVIINHFDYLCIDYFLDSSQVGNYRIVFQISSLFLLLVAIFNISFAPRIAALYSEKKYSALNHIYFNSIKYLLFLSVLIFIFLFLFGKNLIDLFNADSNRLFLSLLLLSIGFLFYASFAGSGHILSLTGNPMLQFYRLLIAMAINVSLNIFLIPELGILGASIASMVSLITSSIIGLIFSYVHFKKLNLKTI